MKRRLLPILLIVVLTHCENNSKNGNSQDVVEKLYSSAGLPRSSKYVHDIQGFTPTQTKQQTNQKYVTQPKLKVSPKNKAALEPWKNNQPVSPEETQRLLAFYDQAWEYYRSAENGESPQKNWLKAADFFIKASRYPEKDHRVVCVYNAACSFSLANKTQKAIVFLRLSIELGFRDFEHIKQDTDFKNIRQKKEFQEILSKYTNNLDNQKPETSSEEKSSSRKHLRLYKKAENLYDKKEFILAAQAYQKSAHLDSLRKQSYYNEACCWALSGSENKKKALIALKKAVLAGWNDFDYLSEDKDLETLKDEKEFILLLKNKKIFLNQNNPEENSKPNHFKLSAKQQQGFFELYEKALSLYQEKNYSQAAEFFEKSAELKSLRKNALYNLACCWALMNQREKSLIFLEKALNEGWIHFEHMNLDSDLKNLRKLPEYQILLETYASK